MRESPFEVRRRYRSQPILWLLPVAAILLAVLVPVGLDDWGITNTPPVLDRLYSIALGAILVASFLHMHETFLVGPEGVERRRFHRRDRWRWDEMAGLTGRQVEDLSDRGDWTGSTATYAANDIRDEDGRVLFRLGPWIQKRTKLAILIRRGIAETRSKTSGFR